MESGNNMEYMYEIVKIKKEIVVREDLAPLSINSSYSIAQWLQNEIGHDTQENFAVLCLDTKNKLNCFSVVHRGTATHSTIHPRDIFQRAYLSNATRIIVAHNHPSNDCTPSEDDNDTTKRIQACGELLAIPLLDHIIVGQDTYFSYSEQRLLRP